MGRSGDTRERGNSKCKDPEAGKSWVWLRNNKEPNMAVRERVAGDKVSQVGKAILCRTL